MSDQTQDAQNVCAVILGGTVLKGDVLRSPTKGTLIQSIIGVLKTEHLTNAGVESHSMHASLMEMRN